MVCARSLTRASFLTVGGSTAARPPPAQRVDEPLDLVGLPRALTSRVALGGRQTVGPTQRAAVSPPEGSRAVDRVRTSAPRAAAFARYRQRMRASSGNGAELDGLVVVLSLKRTQIPPADRGRSCLTHRARPRARRQPCRSNRSSRREAGEVRGLSPVARRSARRRYPSPAVRGRTRRGAGARAARSASRCGRRRDR